MRVLLGCSLGGEGHLQPLVGVARAVARAGHEAKLLVPPSLAPSTGRAGIEHCVGAEPPRAFVQEIWERVRRGPAPELAGLIDRELFADHCTAAMLPAARKLMGEWRPGLVVREPCEYSSALVAVEAGVPQAQIAISMAAVEAEVRAMVAPQLDSFASGVADAIERAPYLSSFPVSMDPSTWPDTRRFRWPTPGAPRTGVNASGEPLIYVTFGSVVAHLREAQAAFRAALDAVAGLAVRVLLTVGRAFDRATLGPVPDNVRVEAWVPQDEVLRSAALVVCHGGSGTTFGALRAGVPLVICPLFADQSRNGEAVQRAGAGIVVAGPSPGGGGLRRLGPEDAAALRAAIEAVLGDPTYGEGAKRIAAETAQTPVLDDVLAELLR
jgi:UDP:flavonoid glycosyltransferase YjiC (YdhE family)